MPIPTSFSSPRKRRERRRRSLILACENSLESLVRSPSRMFMRHLLMRVVRAFKRFFLNYYKEERGLYDNFRNSIAFEVYYLIFPMANCWFWVEAC